MAKNIKIALCSSSTSVNDDASLEAHLTAALKMAEQAAAAAADLVLFPEIFALKNRSDWWTAAEPLDGPVITALASQAHRLGIGIAAGHVTLEHGKRYNSLILLDRRGRRAAVYHKTYPTRWELQNGITPGKGAQVVETEFGRLGFAICYDLNFAELRAQYRNLRPSLILFSSFFPGGLQSRWWAFETRAYLASAIMGPGSVLVNPLGRVVSQLGNICRLVITTINLDYEVVHLDYTNRNLDAIRSKYEHQFAFEWAEPEGVFMITSLGKRHASDLVRACGWENAEDYFAQARNLRRRALRGQQLPSAQPPW